MKQRRPQCGAPLFIGVDGGGTGCRARIEDGQGRVLGTGIAGPAAVRLGIEKSMAALKTACFAAAAEAGLPPEALASMDAGIGLAGIGRKGALEQLMAQPHPFRSVIYVNDANIACIGAHGGRDGGIVIVGTGSVGLAVVGGREIRFGGYGFPISDEGSGADLGLQAIRMALRAYDGRAVATGFTREVMMRFHNDPFEAVAWMDRATATDYARLAPLVMRHADAGDPISRRIVRDAAEQIDELIRQLVGSGAPRVALLGGLASPMEPWLAPDVQRRLSPIEGDAVAGALYLARRAALARAS
ncbi:N-acetylglucosamine kinase [Pseudorhodoplanes sinuspersici]|uniref:N-acetylglucosamine kinase n=1 Tax=Pseudorhodoplanes sinuspersici TaxID=1235591 RepID=A0A1W6ZK97_9HYPH|nr:N-acetylglucosamine kinase [Pseudorhodoplanes sinuspersici]ARP97769.1 N-acetylglucosamine kinase [Pseudorhodoplanes sinuspersici]RKE68504.1 glucosamine kinase [Pseudorhodoplanes sinuspersici]